MNKTRNNHPTLNKKVLVLVLLFIGVLTLFTLEKTNLTNLIKLPSKVQPIQSGPTPEEKQAEDTVNAANKQDLIESKTPEVTTVSPSSGQIDLTARQENNNTVTIFTKLYSYTGSGSCELSVTNRSRSTSKTAEIVFQPEYSTCAGFSVPVDSIGSGTWNIKLTTTVNGISQSKSTSLEVK